MQSRFPPGWRWILGAALAVAGCRSYAPQPLDPQEILLQVATEREVPFEEEGVSLARASELMRAHSPRLQEARAAYRTSQAVADTKTPLPNPRLDLAPIFTDVASLGSDQWGGDLALGWTILLGGKRRLNDELNKIRAERDLIDVGATERDEFLALRRDLIHLAMATRIEAAAQSLYKTAERSLTAVRAMVEVADGTALDVSQFQQELFEAEADLLEGSETRMQARMAVGARTGVDGSAFPSAVAPRVPANLPTKMDLRARMMRDHPELARLRAEYAVSEKELEAELAEQYPDLDIGALYERDEGDNRSGIGIGIELPIFDRNQLGIARTDARRNEVRDRFAAQVRRSLADIDSAHGVLEIRRRRLAILRDKLQPTARRTLELARRALEVGSADGLRLLTVIQNNRSMRVRVLKNEQQVLDAWSTLETACGSPLLVFPDPQTQQETQPQPELENQPEEQN